MGLWNRGVTILREQGIKPFLGRGLRYSGNRLLNQSKEERKSEIIDSYSEKAKFLNVGGGNFLKENWRVLDYHTEWYDYDGIFVDHNVDLEKRNNWSINTGEYNLVYSSHTFEHLTDATIKHAFSEVYRILDSGGTFRVNVPNIEIPINHYEANNINWFENVWLENYSDDIYFARSKCPGYELEFYLLSFFATYLARIRYDEIDFSRVREDYETMETKEFLQTYSRKIKNEWHDEYPGWHRNWFTPKRLIRLLKSAGFDDVRRSSCRQSSEPEMCTTHFDKRPHMSVFIEGTKP